MKTTRQLTAAIILASMTFLCAEPATTSTETKSTVVRKTFVTDRDGNTTILSPDDNKADTSDKKNNTSIITDVTIDSDTKDSAANIENLILELIKDKATTTFESDASITLIQPDGKSTTKKIELTESRDFVDAITNLLETDRKEDLKIQGKALSIGPAILKSSLSKEDAKQQKTLDSIQTELSNQRKILDQLLKQNADLKKHLENK